MLHMLPSLFGVILLVCYAHAAFIIPSKDNIVVVTSSLLKTFGDAEAANSKRNLLSLDGISNSNSNLEIHESVVDSRPSSVVQDWSLVCKQLCGAGLGGAACTPDCNVELSLTPSIQATHADSILNPNKELICSNLCRLQLGKINCDCSNVSMNDVAVKPTISLTERNEVCNTFCTHNEITLAGCSPCALQHAVAIAALSEEKEEQEKQRDDCQEAQAAGDDTTPNWDDLCVQLCKTGDGGALCKCDLSPFA